jgi:hypothetical protein
MFVTMEVLFQIVVLLYTNRISVVVLSMTLRQDLAHWPTS